MNYRCTREELCSNGVEPSANVRRTLRCDNLPILLLASDCSIQQTPLYKKIFQSVGRGLTLHYFVIVSYVLSSAAMSLHPPWFFLCTEVSLGPGRKGNFTVFTS